VGQRRRRFQQVHGYGLHLRRAVTYSDWINHRILVDRSDTLAWTCDKLRMRAYAESLGVAVPELLWSGVDADDVAGVELPDRWVFKPNHRSGAVHLARAAGRPRRDVRAAAKLAAPFTYMRVDLYDVDGRVVSGELTPYPGSGMHRFPCDLDLLLGRQIPASTTQTSGVTRTAPLRRCASASSASARTAAAAAARAPRRARRARSGGCVPARR
jgi:hypothetical protein